MDQDVPQLPTLKKIFKCVGAGGGKACTGLPFVLDTLRDGKLTQQLYHRGEMWWRKKRGGEVGAEVWTWMSLYLILAGVSRHLFCNLASLKVLTVTRSLLF